MRVLLAACALASAAPIVAPAPACAASAGRASVHVVFEDGRTESRCIGLDAETVTGVDALRATGNLVTTEEFAGAGSLVCSIDGRGRDFPAESCVPPCPTGRCRFWAYFTRDRATGLWAFSDIGASARVLRDGDADAWVLGVHRVSGTTLTARLDDAVCARGLSPRVANGPVERVGFTALAPLGVIAAFGAAAARRIRRRRAA